MPIVRQMATRMFGRFPRSELNPDEVVALGAGVQAGLIARACALDDIVLTDVMPYSPRDRGFTQNWRQNRYRPFPADY